MLWAVFLHLYQPPSQRPEILEAVVSQSYRPILRILKENATAKITVNIDGCLIDQLLKAGFTDVISELKGLVAKGQVELVSSVKYHAFLPLIPETEIIRRVKASLLTLNASFDLDKQPRGFFPPELAVNPKIVKVAKKLGFSYLLADESSLRSPISNRDSACLYEEEGVKIFFANRQISSELRGNYYLDFENLTAFIIRQGFSYLVTANDAEVFGHHYPKREEILARIVKEQGKTWELVTLTELLEKIDKITKIHLRPGSWETSPQDLKNGLPFPLWHNPDNVIQKLYWQLGWLAISCFDRMPSGESRDPGLIWRSAGDHLNRGLASCYLFWASCRPWWNPDMIVAGATELVRVVRSLEEMALAEKKTAEDLYVKIIKTAWDWHWSGEAKRRIDEFEKKGKDRE